MGFVYLQCKVLVCDNSHHQSRCNQSYVSGRKRDISSYKRKSNSVVAPIRLKREVQVESQDFRVKCMQKELRNHLLPVCLYFVHGPRFGCCDVAIIIGRHSVNQRTDYKHQKLQDYSLEGSGFSETPFPWVWKEMLPRGYSIMNKLGRASKKWGGNP